MTTNTSNSKTQFSKAEEEKAVQKARAEAAKSVRKEFKLKRLITSANNALAKLAPGYAGRKQSLQSRLEKVELKRVALVLHGAAYDYDMNILRLANKLIAENLSESARLLLAQVKESLPTYPKEGDQYRRLYTYLCVADYALAHVINDKRARAKAGKGVSSGSASYGIEQQLKRVVQEPSAANQSANLCKRAKLEVKRQVWRIISNQSYHLFELRSACDNLVMTATAANDLRSGKQILPLYTALLHMRVGS